MRIRSLLILPALVFGAASLAAQGVNPPLSPAAATPQWRSFLSANPLGIPFDIVSIEGETAINGTGGTIGLVGSYNDVEKTRFQTLDAHFKYYPGEIPMRGIAVGMSVGYTRFNAELATQPDPTNPVRGQLNASTLGVLVDYNWTQGPSQRFVVGTGIGAKRILASQERRDPLGLDRAYLTGRFVVGLLF